MKKSNPASALDDRIAPLEMGADEFRRVGHALIDQIATFLQSLPARPVTPGDARPIVRNRLGDRTLPQRGCPAEALLPETAELLFDNSLFNGHPRFFGYITSSAAPVGALGELLAAAVNPNVAAWALSPMASEIEKQTIQWIAELLGYPHDCGGLLVSGGNMANFVGFLAARRSRLSNDVRQKGIQSLEKPPRLYTSKATHTWVQKAVDMFGLGQDAVRWIETNDRQQMNSTLLEQAIVNDLANGAQPFMVVGTAGSVGVGAIDPLNEIADICQRHDLWFHVDGAYGAPAAALPEAADDLKALSRADSVAVDPHKWLYNPIEAGCTLVRDRRLLIDAFSFNPEYYSFDVGDDTEMINYYELGPQNTRGFRALKVWLALNVAGRDGYIRMIRDDIALARALFDRVQQSTVLRALTQSLSITTFHFVPEDLSTEDADTVRYLNELNRELMNRLQAGGEAYVSNAVVGNYYALRCCVVNFRSTLHDMHLLADIVEKLGREVDKEIRPRALQPADG